MVIVLILNFMLLVSTSAQPETTTPGPDESVESSAWDLRLVECNEYNRRCRLEIFFHGQWGSVCNNPYSFGQNEANTACRQLGYFTSDYGSTKAFHFEEYNYARSLTSPIWLNGVKCRPTDSTLQSCDHSPIGVNDCSHLDDVAVTCRNEKSEDVRLVNSLSTNAESGRLEVFIEGEWGTVCDSRGSFGQKEADLICTQLGYHYKSTASRYGYVEDLGFEPLQSNSSTRILLDDVRCNYGAVRQDQFRICAYQTSHNCDDHSLDVAIDCKSASNAVVIAVGVVIPILFLCVCLVCLQGCAACIYVHTRKKKPPQAQQTTPPKEKDQPLPDATLQNAPPPLYNKAAAYPPPSYSEKLDPTPYTQQSEYNPKLHHELDEIPRYQQAAMGSDSTTSPSAPPYPVGWNGPPYPDSIPSAPQPT